MEIKKGFMLRQSCRVFSPSQISDSELNYLIEAANAAPQTVDKVPAKAGLFYIYNRFSGIMGLSERRCFL